MGKKEKLEAFRERIKKEFFLRMRETHATWEETCKKSIMPEFIMEEFVEELNWDIVCAHQILSEEFIKKFKKNVNWKIITKVQKISEKFIEEMAEYIDWESLLFSRELSPEFLRRNQEKFQIWINNWHKKGEEPGTLTKQKNWFDGNLEGANQKQILMRNLIKLGYAVIWDEHYEEISEETLDYFFKKNHE